jgi:RNA polymerase sigma-70 factor (ECF subfamily)
MMLHVHPPGRTVAYEVFVRTHGDAVLRFLRRRTDADTADDVFAETMLVVWRRFDVIPSEPLPWLYTTARNCLRDAERAARRRHRLVNRITTVDPPVVAYTHSAGEDDDRVSKALTSLRPADAEILRLWAWEELTPAQIASVLTITVNAATIRLHRAKKRLRTRLESMEIDPAQRTTTEGTV